MGAMNSTPLGKSYEPQHEGRRLVLYYEIQLLFSKEEVFLLLLIALGIGSVLYANNELKLLTDSLRRVIDEKHVFVKERIG